MTRKTFRDLPSIDRLLGDERIKALAERCSRPVVLDAARRYLEEVRLLIGEGAACPDYDAIVDAVSDRAAGMSAISLRRVINATGVLLHTNLGRAPLSRETVEAMSVVAAGYTNLELDLESGKRSTRQVHIEPLICRLTGAEAALVVNNNAGAVLLALAALAKGKEVIVSRGQAVEIGGGFRVPDVMRQSGARLVEVGTTNRTYISDYGSAVTERTAALLRVHSSNFRVVGFTCAASLEEMVDLAREHSIIVLDDLGSGCLLDTAQYGLDHEPTVQESVAAGVGLAFFSGDKLLGGPQAGIVVGKKALVEKVKRHPLARAVRIDKLALAGLAATLQHYARGEAERRIPVWRMLAAKPDDIKARAERWASALGGLGEVVSGESVAGGGSLPGGTLPTWLVSVRLKSAELKDLAGSLRIQPAPVLARVEKNALLLDPRTVLPEEDAALLRSLQGALDAVRGKPA